jgi:hypothetical protein
VDARQLHRRHRLAIAHDLELLLGQRQCKGAVLFEAHFIP